MKRALLWVVALLLPCAVMADDDEGAETASHREVKPLAVEFEKLAAFCLTPEGNLLACDGEANVVKVIDAAGKLTTTWKLDFSPEAIDVAADGAIYVGGEGVLARLDKQGKTLKSIQIAEMDKDDTPPPPSPGGPRKDRVSGIAATEKDVFVAYGSGWSLRSRSRLLRFDREMTAAKRIAENLRGCCQRCDIVARDRVVYVAENTVHRVVKFDREGERLGQWGERARVGLEGFGSCCNPMNLCFDKSGVLYTSESGLGRVKRYTTDGKLLGLVGYVDVTRFEQAGHLAASCSNIAIATTPDGRRVYVMDYTGNRIRVLEQISNPE